MSITDENGRPTLFGIPLDGGAPRKSSSDLAAAAERERQRMALSSKGFSADYKQTGSATGDTTPPEIRKIVLGK